MQSEAADQAYFYQVGGLMNEWRQLHSIGLQTRNRINQDAGRHGLHSLENFQERWLANCLRRNRDTEYGKRYGFREISDSNAYRKRVPVVDYADLETYILRAAAGEPDLLFAGRPLCFERTSGTGGESKLIPYSDASMADFKTAILPWLADLVAAYNLSGGKAYWAISPAAREPECTRGNIKVGVTDDIYLGTEAGIVMQELSAVPAWVAGLKAVADWRLATLYFLVIEPRLELISAWSPTFIIALLDGLTRDYPALAALLGQGGSIAGHSIMPDPEACGRLRAAIDNMNYSILWPRLKLISCWGDASSRPYLEELQRRLPGPAYQPKGLLATEGVVTVPDSSGAPILACHSAFHEFLDSGGNAHRSHELKRGGSYQLVITTSGGLYRYRMGDVLLCEREADGARAPVLRFQGREGLVSDLVGEKLTDAFVNQCLQGISGFRILVPVPEMKPTPRYNLLIDDDNPRANSVIGASIEHRLHRNPHYAYARKVGQLGKLETTRIANPLDAYLEWAGSANRRLADIKVPALLPEPGFMNFLGISG